MRKRFIVYAILWGTIILLAIPVVRQIENLETVSALTLAEPLAAGNVDPSFGGFGGDDGKIETPGMSTRDVVLQPDGKIVVSGKDGADLIVRRYEANGQTDMGFGTGGEFRMTLGQGSPCNFGYSCGLALQPDGKILVAADSDLSGDEDFALLRLTSDGRPDVSFGTNGLTITDFNGLADYANDIALQADGKIVVVGTATLDELIDDRVWGVARYQADGRLDNSFSGDGKLTITLVENIVGRSRQFARGVAIQQDGKIVVAGDVIDAGLAADEDMAFARLNEDGTLDEGFGSFGKRRISFGGDEAANDLVLYPNGRIVAVGYMSEQDLSVNTEYRHAFVQLDTDGDLDPSFDADGKQTINRHYTD